MNEDTQRAYDIMTKFLNDLDRLIEEHLDPEMDRITTKLKAQKEKLFPLQEPRYIDEALGIKPTTEEMNRELAYVQWRDEVKDNSKYLKGYE